MVDARRLRSWVWSGSTTMWLGQLVLSFVLCLSGCAGPGADGYPPPMMLPDVGGVESYDAGGAAPPDTVDILTQNLPTPTYFVQIRESERQGRLSQNVLDLANSLTVHGATVLRTEAGFLVLSTIGDLPGDFPPCEDSGDLWQSLLAGWRRLRSPGDRPRCSGYGLLVTDVEWRPKSNKVTVHQLQQLNSSGTPAIDLLADHEVLDGTRVYFFIYEFAALAGQLRTVVPSSYAGMSLKEHIDLLPEDLQSFVRQLP